MPTTALRRQWLTGLTGEIHARSRGTCDEGVPKLAWGPVGADFCVFADSLERPPDVRCVKWRPNVRRENKPVILPERTGLESFLRLLDLVRPERFNGDGRDTQRPS